MPHKTTSSDTIEILNLIYYSHLLQYPAKKGENHERTRDKHSKILNLLQGAKAISTIEHFLKLASLDTLKKKLNPCKQRAEPI